MELLLKTDVKKLGLKGEIVTVSPGYARNYLLPQDLAAPATNESKKQFAAQSKAEVKRVEVHREELELVVAKIAAMSCTIVAKANPEGHLFGSVGAADIAEAFAKDGVEIKPSMIILADHFKEAGVYTVKVRVASGLTATTRVWIVAE